MLLGILAVGVFCALQVRCCLKAKRKFTKALPLLLAVFLIGVQIALAIWLEEIPDVLNYILDFISIACVLALLGFALGWPVYGAILRARGQGGKVLGWSLAIILLFAGAVMAWWHETRVWYEVDFGSVPEAVDRLEVYTFDYTPENRRLIRTVTDPARIERYKNAYRWEDATAICCDEATRYIIYQYVGDKCVNASRYSFLLSDYNNYAFSLQQLLLILFP